MREIEYNIDLAKSSYNYEACMQNDDLNLIVNMYNKGLKYNLTGATAKLTWIRADGTPVKNENPIIENNTITFAIDKNYTNIAGKARFDIEITKDGTVSTFPLEIFIVEKVLQSKKVNNAILDLIKIIKIDDVIYELVDEINYSLKELKAEFENVVANVTNGNESATNTEVVLARQGEITLATNLEKIKSNIDKIRTGLFEEAAKEATVSDFTGTCVASISNNVLSANNVTSLFSYLITDTKEMEFTVQDSAYIVLGKNAEGFVTIQIKAKSGIDGGLNTWLPDKAGTTIARNVITSDFVSGDMCKIKYNADTRLWGIWKNGSYFATIYEDNYELNLVSHILGFHVSNPNSLTSIENLAEAIKINVLEKSKIEDIDVAVADINTEMLDVQNAIYTKKDSYEEILSITKTEDFVNYGGLTIENEILSKPTAPTSALYPLQIVTNKLEFKVGKADAIMLSGDRKGEFILLWVKHDTKPDMVGKLAICTHSNSRTKYTLDIESCIEGDLIDIEVDEEKITFTKNSLAWFEIVKADYPLISWDSGVYNLGILCTQEKYLNLCSSLKHNKPTVISTPVNTEIEKTNAQINAIKTQIESITTPILYDYATFIGDSISAGYNNTGYVAETHEGGVSWIDTFVKLINITNYSRMATGGILFSRDMLQRVDNIPNNSKLNIVFGGYNDFMVGVPLGNNTDTTYEMIDITYNNKTASIPNSFYGACDTLIKKLMNNNPNARNIIVTPLHAGKEWTPNSQSLHLTEYVEAMKYKCNKYGIEYKVGFNIPISPLIDYHVTNYFHPDKLHPTEAGDVVIAEDLARKIK